MAQECTVVIPCNRVSNTVLLGKKARGFGVGKVCGFGGKVQSNDACVQDAALRELLEEVELEPSHFGPLQYRGKLLFRFGDSSDFTLSIAVFVCSLTTEPECVVLPRCDEFESPLLWHKVDNLPFQEMWPDAEVYYPLSLAQSDTQPFKLHFSYTNNDGYGFQQLSI
jgi:8-oxo-dGTP diphosphatase